MPLATLHAALEGFLKMPIDTTNFDQHSTTDLGSLVDGVMHNDVVAVVRYVREKDAWAIYGNEVVLADTDGGRLFGSVAEVDVFLRNVGIFAYFVDGS